MRKLIYVLVLALATPAFAQVAISASSVKDARSVGLNARLCFTPVNAAETATGFLVGSTQVVPNEVCGTLSAGVLQSGVTLQPTPTGLYYHLYVKASNSNVILRDFGMTPITGSTWTLDSYTQSMAVIPVSSITMGTVTTLGPTDGAYCSIGGGAPAFVLNCGIPSGTVYPGVASTGTGGASLQSLEILYSDTGSHSGSIVGSPTFASAKFSNGLTATSDSNYVSMPASLLPSGSGVSWTIGAWLKMTGTGTYVAVNTSTSTTGNNWIGATSGDFAFAYNGGGPTSSGIAINDNVWHYVELDLIGGTLLLPSVDGVEGTPQTVTAPSASTGTGAIGTFEPATGGFAWPGSIDEVSLWNTDLHTTGFTAPTAVYSGAAANLIALYHLDGNATDSASPLVPAPADGNSYVDASGAGFGTLTPSLNASFAAGGSTLSAATVCGVAPRGGTLASFTALAIGTGNATVDISTETLSQYLAGTSPTSITDGNPLTFSSALGAQVTSFSAWTAQTIIAGQVYCFALTSPASITGLYVTAVY